MDLKAVFLLVFFVKSADIVTGSCDVGWSEYKEDCLYFGHDRRRWQDAENECRKLGGWLASDDNEGKHDYIRTVVNVLRNWHFMRYYVGATDFYFEGDFRWIESGRTVGPFVRWATGSPSTNSTRNCLVLTWQDDTDLVWTDDRCDARDTYFICEKHNTGYTAQPGGVIG